MSDRQTAQRSLRILVLAHNLPVAVRHVSPVVGELLSHGHQVQLVLEPPRRKHEGHPWLNRLAAEPGFSWGVLDTWRRDTWFPVARWLRRVDDYARTTMLGPARAPYLVERAGGRAPRAGRRLVDACAAVSPVAVRTLSRLLSRLDRAVPVSADTVRFFRESRADVLLLVPILMPGSTDSAYIRAAQAAGIPTAVCVPSWDNLSSKQLIRIHPDALFVWNDTQRSEASSLHGIPEERVVVTGAQTFDRWFARAPSDRDEFCARVGLDPSRPYLLYAGGALFPAEITEAAFARRWVESLRTAPEPALRDVGILLRPHPRRRHEWDESSFDDFDGVVVQDDDADLCADDDERDDYLDAIAHSAAVVGINTSAMIEAAIADRPVLTVLVPELHSSQRGTFHFRYLVSPDGGFVQVADSLEQHREQLAATLAGDDPMRDLRARFVRSFVRPHGLDEPAARRFAAAVEGLAGTVPAAAGADPFGYLLLPVVGWFQARRLARKLRYELRRLAST